MIALRRVVLLSFVVGASTTAQAAVLYSTGFEAAEGFTLGALAGQQSWEDISGSNAFVVGTNGQSGQGVTINTGPMTGFDWAYRPLNYTPQTGDIIKSRVSVAHRGFASQANGTLTSRFGLDLFNENGESIARLTVRFAAGSTTQAELQYSTDFNAPTTVNISAGANQWQAIGIDLNTGTNTATFLLNGNVVASTAYTVSDALFADADILAQPVGADTGGFDNYSVEVTPVPEPGTLAALGLGAAALLRKRRR